MNRKPLTMTFFYQVHPVATTLYFLEAFIILMLFNHLTIILAQLLSIIILNLFYAGYQATKKQLRFNLFLVIMVGLFNILLNQKNAPYLFTLHAGKLTFNLSVSALLYGTAMGILIAEMMLIFVVFNKILTNSKILYVFSPIVPRLALLVTISFNLVNSFIQKVKQLSTLQLTRNLDISTGTIKERLLKIFKLLKILLEDSLSSAMETATLMDARGFGSTKRTFYHKFHWQKTDWGFLIFASLITIGLLALKMTGVGATPIVADFTKAYFNLDYLGSILTTCFFILPLIFEGGYRLWEN